MLVFVVFDLVLSCSAICISIYVLLRLIQLLLPNQINHY